MILDLPVLVYLTLLKLTKATLTFDYISCVYTIRLAESIIKVCVYLYIISNDLLNNIRPTKYPSQCQSFKHTEKEDAGSITRIVVKQLKHVHPSLWKKKIN